MLALLKGSLDTFANWEGRILRFAKKSKRAGASRNHVQANASSRNAMVWTAVGREADGAIVASKEADVARLYEHGIAIVVGKAPAAFSLPMAPLDLKPQIVPIG